MMYDLAIIALCAAIGFMGYGVRALGDNQRDYNKAMAKQRQDLRSKLVNRGGAK